MKKSANIFVVFFHQFHFTDMIINSDVLYGMTRLLSTFETLSLVLGFPVKYSKMDNWSTFKIIMNVSPLTYHLNWFYSRIRNQFIQILFKWHGLYQEMFCDYTKSVWINARTISHSRIWPIPSTFFPIH
jgi:hypothetical protein